MNKIFLKGRLTDSPMKKTVGDNLAVCNFTVAVNRRFDREKTDFVRCEAWRGTADFIEKYFSKGKEILLVGELHIDKKGDGDSVQWFTKVNVDEAYFCGGKADGETAEKSNFATIVEEDELLPF